MASAIAVETIREQLLSGYDENLSKPNLKNLMINAINRANEEVHRVSLERPELHGMGTTVVLLVAAKGTLHVAHVGDSRAYLRHGGVLTQITMDHSYVQDLVNFGQITQEEARVHPKRNIITRVLGVHEEVRCDYAAWDFSPGDLALACSDGLSNYMDEDLLDQYMEQIDLMREENLHIASEFLEMAARLVQIKTAFLLPKHQEDEDPRVELTGQLVEYQQCKAAAAALQERANFDALTRGPEDLPVDHTYRREHQPRELLQALVSAWGKGKSLLPPKAESFSALVSRKIVSVASQVVFVLRQLWKGKRVSYEGLFAGKHDRSERVAAFLAVLELVKSRRIRVEGGPGREEVRLLERGDRPWTGKS